MSPHIIEEIMLQYCYPRLDSEVTKGMNHLLKSPFCVHPKTGIFKLYSYEYLKANKFVQIGNVCVPIDAEKVENFDPFKVPTIVELNEQLDRCDMISTDRKIKGIKR
jgi:DNA primase small subunit